MTAWTLDYKPDSKKAGACVWCNTPDGMPVKIASVQRNIERMTKNEFDYNARLIAAAPQLIACLSELCKDKAITRATTAAFEARDKAKKLIADIEASAERS